MIARFSQRGGWLGPGPPPGLRFDLNRRSPQARGLLAWWSALPVRAGATLYDLGDYRLDGSFPGGGADPVWVADGQRGAALLFDGSDDNINVGDPARLDFGANQDFTVTAWLKSSDLSHTNTILRKAGNVDFDGYFLQSLGTTPSFAIVQAPAPPGTVTVNSDVVITTGTWNFLAGQRKGSDIHIFVNGVLTGTAAAFTDSVATTASLYIGRYIGNTTSTTEGLLDDVRIYDYALPAGLIWDMWQPATRWELYRSLARNLVVSTYLSYRSRLVRSDRPVRELRI